MDYSSWLGTPLIYSAPLTPPSTREIGWSSYEQFHGTPTDQEVMYEPKPPQYNSFTTDLGHYVYPTYPHHTIVHPAMISPVHPYGFSEQSLHRYAEELYSAPSNNTSPAIPGLERQLVAYHGEPSLYPHDGSALSSPMMSQLPFSWANVMPYPPPSPQLSYASRSSSMSQPLAEQMNALAIGDERYRRLSSSSAASDTFVQDAQPSRRSRRRQMNKRGPRPYKCAFPGCGKDFERSYNARQHRIMVHEPQDKPEKCRVDPNCHYAIEGFSRKHDLKRHEKKVSLLRLMNGMLLTHCSMTRSNPTNAITVAVKLREWIPS